MSSPDWLAYRPQFKASRERSIVDVDVSKCPTEFQKSVPFVLQLLDVLIYNYPRPKIQKPIEEKKATEIDQLKHLPNKPTVWVARETDGFGDIQFPEGTRDWVVTIAIYKNVCDFATMIAKELLQKFVGTAWQIRRISIEPKRKDIFVCCDEHSEIPFDSVTPYYSAHSAVGIFSRKANFEEDSGGLFPEYVFDPTILQFGEQNHMRFVPWDQYNNFAQGGWKNFDDATDAAFERMDMGAPHWWYWKDAKDISLELLQERNWNIDAMTDIETNNFLKNLEERLRPLMTDFVIWKFNGWASQERVKPQTTPYVNWIPKDFEESSS